MKVFLTNLNDKLKIFLKSVTAVENGRIARDELLKEDSNFDIVLLDLIMPEMDGLELLMLM
jgi:CheY-like chemotaxis protein